MKKITIFLLLICLFCSFFVGGCAKKEEAVVTTVVNPPTTPPATTTVPSTTTQPPETEAPYVPLDVKLDPEVYYIDTCFWYKSQGECPDGYYQVGEEGWEEVASHMTTRALVESVLTYPKLAVVEASSQTWLLYILNKRIGIVEELLSRDDLEWVLYNYKLPEETEENRVDLIIMELWFNRLKMYVYGADYLWDQNAEFKQVEMPW